MTKRSTMRDVDHASPFADELTSVWRRGAEDRPEEDDATDVTESGERDLAETVADD